MIYRLSHRMKPLPTSADNIVMISIDDRSGKILNARLPWDRKVFTDCLKVLETHHPKVVAFDVAFVGESRDPAIDDEFVAQTKKMGNVILASYFSPTGEYMRPQQIFADACQGYGFINKPRDKDLVIRNARAAVYRFDKRNEVLDYSFAIKTLASFLDVPLSNIRLKNNTIIMQKDDGTLVKEIPVGPSGIFPLKFRVQLNDLNVLPLYKVINGDFPKGTFTGKIVIVGMVTEIHHDIYPTPLRLMHGPAINANELIAFFENDFVQTAPWLLQFAALMLVGLLTALHAHRFSPLSGLCITATQTLALALLSILLVFKGFHARYFDLIFASLVTYLGVNAYKYALLTVESIALKTQAVTDGLTGLYVFRYFELRLQSELNKAKTMNQQLTLVMADIDHFKQINDTYGHHVGNTVLIQISKVLAGCARKSDVVCRYGGEEFAIIMVGTNAENSLHYVGRVTHMLKEIGFMHLCGVPSVTLSFGIATFPEHHITNSKELIESADKALYHAKQTGRNRVSVYKPNLSTH